MKKPWTDRDRNHSPLGLSIGSNTAQPCTASPQQNQAAGCVMRNLRKKTVALGRVNFCTSPDDENYVIDKIIDEHMDLCVGDGKLGDIDLGEMIEWPKQYITRHLDVESHTFYYSLLF
ncbi:hypothetical protein MKW98_016103 [Papaver atlanticum]|uniref:Uncharacterized protein n=1 Tax=Papaver atlanticum TaxID=357466 RepID=A0AAD4T5M5_9MAGN|nr:hypothetical protein MKW98_016103 [Papaver atlanticum]